MSAIENNPRKVIRLQMLKDKTGISSSSIYNKMNPKSKYYDQYFPKPVRLGASSVGWYESDVDGWLNNLQKVQ